MAPPRLILLMFTILGSIIALARVIGPIVGGLLAMYMGWRYAFWIKYAIAYYPKCASSLIIL